MLLHVKLVCIHQDFEQILTLKETFVFSLCNATQSTKIQQPDKTNVHYSPLWMLSTSSGDFIQKDLL